MKFTADIKIIINKSDNTLHNLVKLFDKYEIYIKQMNCSEIKDNLAVYDIELIHAGLASFSKCINEIKKEYGHSAIEIKSELDEIVEKGLIQVIPRIPFENMIDFEIKLLGAAEIAISKIKSDEKTYVGASNAVAFISAISTYSEDVDVKSYEHYSLCERDAAVTSNFTTLNAYPITFKFSQADEIIRFLNSIDNSFSVFRIAHVDGADGLLYEEIKSSCRLPMLIKDYDELPIYLMALLHKIIANYNIDKTVSAIGILGLDVSTIRITSILKQMGFTRILGYGEDEESFMTFEKKGGMTTTPENIAANTDVLILKSIDEDISILNKMRPGQVVISTVGSLELIELCKQRGVRKLIIADEIEHMQIFSGLLLGMKSVQIKNFSDENINQIAKKISSLLDENYKMPGIFGNVHSVINEFVEFTFYTA